MNAIILQLLALGLTLEVKQEANTSGNPEVRFYFTSGFYKSNGSAYLVEEPDGQLVLHARYGDKDKVDSLSDVVSFSYQWWKTSQNRCEGWKNPSSEWADLYVQHNLVKRVVSEVVSYI